jgi:membrane associated rhomboid family serine protease
MISLPSETPPTQSAWVNYALIAANLLVFAYEMTLGTQLESFLLTYGWAPANFSHALTQGHPLALASLWTSMFLHGGWLHLLGNVLYLHLFGGAVENRLGHLRYLCFYALGGAIATLMQTYGSPWSTTSMIGASGAIATVAGAYVVFFPAVRILTLVPLVFSSRILRVPAVWYLLPLLIVQLISGTAPLTQANQLAAGGAWWAHIGGFIAGILLGPLFLIKKRRPRQELRLSPVLWNNPKSALRW